MNRVNRVLGWPGLLWGVLTAVGCGGAEPVAAPETQAPLAVQSEALTSRTAASSWALSAPFGSRRVYNHAALLDSGLVLMMGGRSGDAPVGYSSLYNPYENTWQATGSMEPLYWFASVKLASGKIFISGGWEYWYMNSGAQVYDPATGVWSRAASMSRPRYDHRATLLSSGKVLVTGGLIEVRNGPDLTSENPTAGSLYDPETNLWTPGGDIGHGTRWSVPVRLYSGEVLLVDGYNVDLYDPSTNTWRAVAAPSVSLSNHTATRLYSGEVLVVSGASSHLYSPYSGQWRAGPALKGTRSKHTATLLYSGKVLVAGGGGTELYDPSSNTWTQQPASPESFKGGSSVMLHTGQVLLTGGEEFTTAAAIFTP